MKKVTSIEELRKVKMTVIEELPPFDDGTPFVAELKKPNMMALITSGSIPNTLLTVTMDMFVKGKGNEVTSKAAQDPKALTEMVKLLDVLAEVCLVNPTMEELRSEGIELTENQNMALMMFAQGGVKSLESFRKKFQNSIGPEPVTEV